MSLLLGLDSLGVASVRKEVCSHITAEFHRSRPQITRGVHAVQ